MAIWQVDIYDNKNDQGPSKTGYVEADTEAEAIEAVTANIGDSKRADLTPKAARLTSLPKGLVLWEML